MVLLVASSSIDLGIGCWDLHTGAEQLRYKSCASPAHGLVCVGERFLACSLLRDPASTAGSVLYWSQCKGRETFYEHNFTGHNLPVTNIVVDYGGSNAIIISSSVDRTCKVWILSNGKLLRNIIFPSIIDAIALDPGERVFYGGVEMRSSTLLHLMLNAHPAVPTDFIFSAHCLIKEIE
ncbi:Protein ROOT INITIATION DEFECTIVE 3, partial [Cucurbita argyrosperma subsp. sororia]